MLDFRQVELMPSRDLTSRENDWYSFEYPYQLRNINDSSYSNLNPLGVEVNTPGFREIIFNEGILQSLKAGDLIALPDHFTVIYNLESHLPGRLFTPFRDTKWQKR